MEDIMILIPAVEDRLALNIVEIQILEDFKSNKLNDEFFTTPSNLESIIKIAQCDNKFEQYCQKEQFSEYWILNWCLDVKNYFPKLNTYFSPQTQIPSFNLLRGWFFYKEALNTAKIINKEFLYTEMEYLKIAISYNSVHAIQRYNKHGYELIEGKNDNEEIEAIYINIIQNCKKITSSYGSYAFLMLAEACAKYGGWLIQQSNNEKANLAFEAMCTYCDKAQKCLKDSKDVIHNASFGVGLQASNSFEIADPMLLKETLNNEYFEFNLVARIMR